MLNKKKLIKYRFGGKTTNNLDLEFKQIQKNSFIKDIKKRNKRIALFEGTEDLFSKDELNQCGCFLLVPLENIIIKNEKGKIIKYKKGNAYKIKFIPETCWRE